MKLLFSARELICRASLGLLLTGASAAIHAADLQVTVRNLLPDQGHLLLALFQTEQGFPDAPLPSQPRQQLTVQGGTMTTSFKNLAPGRYAVMVVQDLNGNGRVDTNFVGMPTEPYGASNNRLPRLSAPKYEEALVDVGSERSTITIDVRRP